VSREVVRVKLNPALLAWARQSSGYDVDEVARSLTVAPQVIAAWEKGEQKPTIRQLEKFANKVKRPLAALFLPAPPTEPPPPRDFRMLPDTESRQFAPATLLAFRQARTIQQDAIALAEALGESIHAEVLRGTLHDDPEQLAGNLRNHLGVSVEEQLRWRDSYKALSAWKGALERSGILVLQFSMPREDARGFTLEGDRVPVIVVTSKDAPDARIFSLFHEYCHLMLGYSGVSGAPELIVAGLPHRPKAIIEAFCNRFAAAFLLPNSSAEVASRLSALAHAPELDRDAIRSVARKFKVSKDVVLRRMLTQGLITEDVYREMVTRWSREAALAHAHAGRGGGPDFVTMRLQERGQRFAALVLDALDHGAISEAEASDYLAVYPNHLDAVREKMSLGTVNE
jgi:Zn-dependent peptidase ImmA (M78 family)/transcriptional regulator with XRE-family HTH domain